MNNFFEFEKKSSDGIRRKSAHAIPASLSLKKHIEAEPPIPSAPPALDIRTVAYEEEETLAQNFAPHAAEARRVSAPAETAQREPVQKQHSSFKERRVRSVAARFSGLFAIFSRKDDTPLSLSEEIQKDSKSKLLKWGTVSGIAVLVAGGAVLSMYFSRLVVTVHPALALRELSDVQIILDHKSAEVNSETKTLPAELLEFSRVEKASFPATGQKYVEERAHGIVRIYNRFSSVPQRLVASTRFVTDKGAVYRLIQAVTVPGAAIEGGAVSPRFVEAELVADKPGNEGNFAGSATLKIPGFHGTPKYEGFYAEAMTGFQGGMKGESKVATKEDIAHAEEDVTKKVYDAVKLEVAKKIPPDFKIIDGLREIEIAKVTSPKISAAGDIFEVEARAVGRVLVFREADISLALRELFLQDKKNSEEIKNMSEVDYTVKKLDMKSGRAELSLAGKIYLKPVIAGRELASLLQGKREQDLLQVLRGKTEIKDFSLSLFPPWTFRAPEGVERIRVIIED